MTEEIFMALRNFAIDRTKMDVLIILSYYAECPLLRCSAILQRVEQRRTDELYVKLYWRLSESVGKSEKKFTTAKDVLSGFDQGSFHPLHLITMETLWKHCLK
jgi:hypothetical protein